MLDKQVLSLIGDDVVIAGGSSVMRITGAAKVTNSGVNKGAKEKEPADNLNIIKTKSWSIWGNGDDWPQLLMEKLDKLGVAKSGLDIKSDLHYGTGIGWFKEVVDEATSTLTHKLSNPAGWRKYSLKAGIDKGVSDAILSRHTFNISAVRFTLNELDGVYKIKLLDTPSMRVGFRDKITGKISNVYYAQDIHLKNDANQIGVVTYPVYDEDNHDAFIAKNKVFVYLIQDLTWGRFYYGEPNYFTAFNNNWVDIAIEVPKLIKYIYKNQATLKYHVSIPISVFEMKYGATAGEDSKCWEQMSSTEQAQAFADYKTEIEATISKAEAAGASVVSIYKDDHDKVEITPIENKLNSANDLPNNVAANSEILFAIGIDPSLLGLNMPGGKDLNGSGGSDKRESLKIAQATLTRDRIDTLKMVTLIGDLNGYPEDLYAKFIEIDVSQTLDQNPTGKKTVVGG